MAAFGRQLSYAWSAPPTSQPPDCGSVAKPQDSSPSSPGFPTSPVRRQCTPRTDCSMHAVWRCTQSLHEKSSATQHCWQLPTETSRGGVLRKVVVDDGGFTRFRRAAETPFNIILEARP